MSFPCKQQFAEACKNRQTAREVLQKSVLAYTVNRIKFAFKISCRWALFLVWKSIKVGSKSDHRSVSRSMSLSNSILEWFWSPRDFKNQYIFVSGGLQIRVYSRLVAKSCLLTFLEGFWSRFGASSKPLEGLWGCLVGVLGASLEVFGLRWRLAI